MATPPTAQRLGVTRDPGDLKPIGFNFAPMLDPGEKIDSYTLTISAEGVAAGMSFATGSGRDPAPITGDGAYSDDTVIKAWPVIAGPHQADSGFAGSGVDIAVTVHIVTTSVPYREHEETFLIPWAQK